MSYKKLIFRIGWNICFYTKFSREFRVKTLFWLDETSDLKGRNNKFDVVISLVCAWKSSFLVGLLWFSAFLTF